jgi:hypothetical protein
VGVDRLFTEKQGDISASFSSLAKSDQANNWHRLSLHLLGSLTNVALVICPRISEEVIDERFDDRALAP